MLNQTPITEIPEVDLENIENSSIITDDLTVNNQTTCDTFNTASAAMQITSGVYVQVNNELRVDSLRGIASGTSPVSAYRMRLNELSDRNGISIITSGNLEFTNTHGFWFQNTINETPFTYYDVHSADYTFDTNIASTTVAIQYTRIGNIVHARIPAVNAITSAAAFFTSTGVIPTDFQSATTQSQIVTTDSIFTATAIINTGLVVINSATNKFEIYYDIDKTSLFANNSGGLTYEIVFTYTL